MSVISAHEEQIFREIAARYDQDAQQAENPSTLFRIRKPMLLTIWVVSLMGTFGMVQGAAATIGCAVSLAVATGAIVADYMATASGELQPR